VRVEPETSPQRETDADPKLQNGGWQRFLARAEAAVANPFLAYGAILVLQLRVIWNVWQHRDLTAGDTSSYFRHSMDWPHGLQDNIVWSPLYTSFLGTIAWLVDDVPTAVMTHRVAIVLCATVLVLAVMRALLGPAIGLLVAAWWAVLPSTFDVEYEVHLFGLLPILVAALVLVRAPGRRGRGIALGVLAGTTLLLRNELVIATAIFALTIAIVELRERRETRTGGPSLSLGRAYGVPLLIVCVLTAGAYWRSVVQGSEAQQAFRAKHELNVCQVYAFNYQQRHPSRFSGNPFLDCGPLMQRHFGEPLTGFLEATTTNPGAVARFVAWNTRLFPSGVQVALFDATSTGDTPGYFPVKNNRLYATALTFIALATLIAGLTLLLRDRYWRREWLPPRAWAILLLASVAATTLVVALTQRPRAEYLYGLTVFLLGLFGLCLAAFIRHLRIGSDLVAALAAAVIVALAVGIPSYYHAGPRPLHDAVDRLQVVRGPLQEQGSVLVTAGFNSQICAYLSYDTRRTCASPDWQALKAQVVGGRSIRDVFDEAKVTAIYANPVLQADPILAGILASPAENGWRQVAQGKADDGEWSVLLASPATSPGRPGEPPSALRRLPEDLGIPGLEYSGIFADGWLEQNARVVLSGGPASDLTVRAEALPPEPGGRQRLRVLVDGRVVASRSVGSGLVDIRVPVAAAESDRQVELRWATTTAISARDPRRAAALLKFLGFSAEPTSSAPPELQNGGFETETTDWPTGDADTKSVTATRDSAVRRFGSRSLKVVNTDSGDDGYVAAVVAAAPRSTYVVSAWVNVRSFTDAAIESRGLYAIARASGTYSGGTEASSDITASTSNWIRKRVVVTTGAADDEIEIRLYAPNATTYWDGVRIEQATLVRATLSAEQVVPRPAVAGVGARGTFAATLSGQSLDWTLAVSGLSGPPVAAVIRSGQRGQLGERLVPLCEPCNRPARGTVELTKPQAAAVLEDATYVNVGTELNPTGEIRGQIRRR
jgi:CHRD domain